jgi:hypothetical protein
MLRTVAPGVFSKFRAIRRLISPTQQRPEAAFSKAPARRPENITGGTAHFQALRITVVTHEIRLPL